MGSGYRIGQAGYRTFLSWEEVLLGIFSVEQHLLLYSTKVRGYMLKNAGIKKSRAMYVNENANGRATLVCGLCALLAFIKALYSQSGWLI